MLALGIDSYNFGNVSLNRPEYYLYAKNYSKEVYSQVLQNAADRISKSFKNFYRRVKDKRCKQKGFPRFKTKVCSITYPQSGFKFLSDKKLHLSKIGNIPIKLHRIPKGIIKTLTIKINKANQWFACFSCESNKPNSSKKEEIHKNPDSYAGIDVGINNFAALSDGNIITNPRFLVNSENKLKKLQRMLSKKKKGSKNRLKAKLKLAKFHIKIANQRNDFLHKISSNIANKYSIIKAEALNIKNMVKNHHLAKHINDASWNSFIQMLSYKAVKCGGQLIKVVSRNTSKTCSNCGNEQEMPLSKREFICNDCGFACDRDINAAINILNSTAGLAETYKPAGDYARLSARKAVINESGTIFGEEPFLEKRSRKNSRLEHFKKGVHGKITIGSSARGEAEWSTRRSSLYRLSNN